MRKKELNIERVQTVSLEGRTANQMIFILADLLEIFYKISDDEAKIQGLKFDKKTETSMLMFKYAVKDLRHRTTEMGIENQISFGEDADKLMMLIMYVIDRTGDNYKVMDQVTNYAKSIPSKWRLNLRKFF